MATLVLELNDAGLLAFRERVKKPVLESPGLALLEGDTLLTGETAARGARLKPRFRHTRFWEALDRKPVAKPFPKGLTHADLVHAHLSDVWRELKAGIREVVLVVPGFYSDDQLSLLLGITRACGIPVTALVDTAIACETPFYLDIFAHRATITRTGSRQVRVDDAVGIVPLVDAWVQLVARSFVRQTRFDPLHRADTEQRLYDEIPRLLETLAANETVRFAFQASGKERAIDLDRDQIVEAARPHYARLVELVREPGATTLSHRVGALPGLVEMFPAKAGIAVAPADRAARAVLENLDRLSLPDQEGALRFVTAFERAPAPPPSPAKSPPPIATEKGTGGVTHVLLGNTAHAIDPSPFHIGLTVPDGMRGLALPGTAGISEHHCSFRRVGDAVFVEDHSTEGCYVNDARVDAMSHLRAGDRLRLGDSEIELRLIEVKG